MARGESNEAFGKWQATKFREKYQLGNHPIYDLIGLIESTTGYDVAVIPAEADSHGLTMWDPERGRGFIAVAQGLAYVRQRSSLAHELCHVLRKDNSVDLAERNGSEIRADAFARHLLVPIDGVKELLKPKEYSLLRSLSAVVQHFRVSPMIAAIAMRDAGLITKAMFDEWDLPTAKALATQFGWYEEYLSLQNEADRARPPRRLVARSIEAYQKGLISAQVIATLRGTSVDQVLEELSSAGIFPAEVNACEYELTDLPEVHIDLSALGENGD